MIRKILLSSLVAGLLCGGSVLAPAQADSATILGVFGNWSAYSSGSGDAMTCYALSKPRAMEPKGAKRSAIYLMVSDWPGRKIKGEPEIVLGYPARETVPANLEIGADKFPFFVRNAPGKGGEGSAWLRTLGDGTHLLDSMSAGVSAVARATSTRGTNTVDTYSLAGFANALAKIHAACNM